ncbi:MAG: insulinase family protein [Bacteroidales bacterium]|jgi:predicted Zn-dependent peptidase|nr:insulinase family protein [Bacteroidales bacterium]
MKTLKFIPLLLASLIILLSSCGETKKYKYETVPDDPMNTRIYTLNNGLKVFLTVYKDEPRIQTYIPVKAGSKNDPSETTGLAHYFEHMMFKGSPNFGTLDWETEKGMIAQIDSLFEIYRTLTEEEERAQLYRVIDSISFEASKLAIPNEYDKLMQAIGAKGTNAGTSNDYTIYIENIPSNQLENWAKIQADRFLNPVLRLFHSELETIYEEKNMSLTQDNRKVTEALFEGLYPNHPYGQQTTLGSQEHLRNPSMKNIREFYSTYYVANNMAVVMSGDFDYDEAIRLIDKYFSVLPSGDAPELKVKPESPIAEPIKKEVVGLEAENIRFGYRLDLPANHPDIYIANMLSEMMYNGKAGLIDINLVQKQKVYYAYATTYELCDNSSLIFGGAPKTGQTLDEVKDLIIEQIELLKQGQFEDWMLQAAIDNMKLHGMRRLESNSGRAMWLSSSFMNNIPWNEACKLIETYSKITKQQIVDFANKYLNNNYVAVYKLQGTPPEISKIAKPDITPIHVNRDVESDFLKEIKASKTASIEPVFIDFDKEITKVPFKGSEILSIQNKENKTFSLYFHFPMGTFNNLKLPIAIDYLEYLGTSKYSPEEIQQEFYKLACSYGIYAGQEESRIYVSGLSDNMEKALTLVEALLSDPQPNDEALKNVITDILKSRDDAKANQNQTLNALVNYGEKGKDYVNYKLSETELHALTSTELLDIIKNLTKYKHQILYYGTETANGLANILEKYHKIGDELLDPPATKEFPQLETTSNKVYWAHYDANQSRLQTYSRSVPYDASLYPVVSMYNSYFGGGMNAIVFQEMREKRSLAYMARSRYNVPLKKDEYYENYALIATQNDKIIDALDAFNELFNEMPESEVAFANAKEGLKTQIATERITKMNIIWRYMANQKLGANHDMRKDLYDAIPKFTLADVKKFNQEYIKNQHKTYFILSKEVETPFEELQKYGPIQKLTLEEIFGY